MQTFDSAAAANAAQAANVLPFPSSDRTERRQQSDMANKPLSSDSAKDSEATALEAFSSLLAAINHMPPELLQPRKFEPEEIAQMVKSHREVHGWTQETLAEIAGISERSVRRVEDGAPTSMDTLRALARAFNFEDIDFFTKHQAIPTAKQVEAYKQRLEAETVTLQVSHIATGAHMRGLISETHGQIVSYRCTSPDAEEAFAAFADLVRDYADLSLDMSETERLEMARVLDEPLNALAKLEHAVVAGVRKARLPAKNGMPETPFNVLYLLCCPVVAIPTTLRVARKWT